MLRLTIIVASTRPGRVGPAVGEWFEAFASAHGAFEVTLTDLAQVNLPLFDEPAHPRLRQYEHEHTKRWSAVVNAADAFVLVTPEYNFSPAPSLVNALDYLYQEWNYKPAAFVSYGGISGGLRAVQAAKLIVTALKIMPIPEGVAIPLVAKQIDEAGRFLPNEYQENSAALILDELHRWAAALKPLHSGNGG